MLCGGLRVNGVVMRAAEFSPVSQGLKPRALSVLYGMSKLMPSRKNQLAFDSALRMMVVEEAIGMVPSDQWD